MKADDRVLKDSRAVPSPGFHTHLDSNISFLRRNWLSLDLSPRWYKVFRDLWHNKTRTILVLLSIAVGVMGIGMISGAQEIMSRDMTNVYLATNPRHAIIFTERFDHELIQVVKRVPGVADAEGLFDVNVRLNVGPDEWQNLLLVVVEDYTDIGINQIWHLEGSWPPLKREMLLERASFDELDLQIGDIARIQLPNGKERQLRVSGRVHDISQVPLTFSGQVQGYITQDTLETLGWPRGYDELNITVTEKPFDREHIRQITEQVKQKIEKGGHEVYGEFIPEPGKHWANDEVNSMLYLLSALGILSLFMSAFLVVNTMSALLTQQIRQIGVMKAIGAQRSHLLSIYLSTVLVYGILSLLIGVPLGALGAMGITSFMAGLLNFDIVRFNVPFYVLALEIAVGVVTPMLAALYPILRGTRITVREAVSDYGLGKGQFGQGLVDRAITAIRVISRPSRLSLRNTFRRKGRLVLVTITLTLASAIFIGVLSVQASLLLTLDDASRYWNYDIWVGFGRSYRIEALEHEALQVPGIVKAESWGFQDVVRKRNKDEQSDNILMIAPPIGTELIDPLLIEGRWLLPEDEKALVINTDLRKEEPDLQVGDDIVLEIDERESTWRIVGLIKQPLSGPFVYTNYPTFAREVRNIGQVSNLRVVTEYHDGEYQAKTAQALEEHFERKGFQVRRTQTTTQDRLETENQFNIIVVFLLIMAVLLAIVGGLGLMGTMSINVLERTREVGVIRAIGAPTKAVLRIVVIEGIVIGLMSWVIGALISIPLGRVLSDQVGILFLGAPASYAFSSTGALLWLGAMIVIATLASFLPAWNAARLTVRETLAYQ